MKFQPRKRLESTDNSRAACSTKRSISTGGFRASPRLVDVHCSGPACLCAHPNFDRTNLVRSRQNPPGIVAGSRRAVRKPIAQWKIQVRPQPQNRPSALTASSASVTAPRPCVALNVFAACRTPLDGPPDALRRKCNEQVLGIDRRLAAKSTTHIGAITLTFSSEAAGYGRVSNFRPICVCVDSHAVKDSLSLSQSPTRRAVRARTAPHEDARSVFG